MKVAALFVESGGVYCGDHSIDAWDKERDAFGYAGPHPVVAHPPCQLWTNFAHLNFKRWGGEHNRPGNDGGAFHFAVTCVRRFGGVLEHPAFSMAWPTYELPQPEPGRWRGPFPTTSPTLSSWVCEVWQSAYGHKARKRTWLYYCGARPPAAARWDRTPGTHQCGWFDRRKPTLGKREASRTPPAFAEYLISLARGAS